MFRYLKDPWSHVLSLPGAQGVCWRPHLAGMRQYSPGEESLGILTSISVTAYEAVLHSKCKN